MDSHIQYLYNVIDYLGDSKFFSAFKNFKSFIVLSKLNITQSANYNILNIPDIVELLYKIIEQPHDIYKYDIDNILYNLKYYTNIPIKKCSIILNGLLCLLKNTDEEISDLDGLSEFSIMVEHTDLHRTVNYGYVYGFISSLVANELMFINYDCGKQCNMSPVGSQQKYCLKKDQKKHCTNVFFHTMDGKLSGTGSKTIVFRNQSLFDLEYKYNYELIARILYRSLGNTKMSSIDKITYIRKQTVKLVNMLNVFVLSFRPTLFTKLYYVPKYVRPYHKYTLCNDPNNINMYLDALNDFAKYRCLNEKKISQYLTNVIHDNHLPHIISHITNISCDDIDTKLNDIRLTCGSLKECFGVGAVQTPHTYELLLQEHIGKNSMTLKEFVKYSSDDDVQINDIIAIIIQFAYSTYVMNYILGISHTDIHIENIYVEKHWRCGSIDYVIMFGQIMKQIYDTFATMGRKDIFKNCRETEKDAKWASYSTLKTI